MLHTPGLPSKPPRPSSRDSIPFFDTITSLKPKKPTHPCMWRVRFFFAVESKTVSSTGGFSPCAYSAVDKKHSKLTKHPSCTLRQQYRKEARHSTCFLPLQLLLVIPLPTSSYTPSDGNVWPRSSNVRTGEFSPITTLPISHQRRRRQ